MPELTSYLEKLKAKNASELVLCADRVPLYRHGASDRTLAPLPGEAPVSAHELATLLGGLVGAETWAMFQAHGALRFAVDHAPGTRIAGTCMESSRGVTSALRVLSSAVLSCEMLDLPPAAIRCSEHSTGLYLVTGPMGSGKTTTLAALVDHLLDQRGRHVVTIEDPIELMHESGRGLVSHRQVGAHCGSFAEGIVTASRCDAELIVVGELDANGAFEAALAAAQAGAFVIGAVRSSSSERAHAQLLAGVPTERRARAKETFTRLLRCTLGQRLLPCKTGGHVAAYEVALPNPGDLGNQTLEVALEALLRQGVIEAADKLRV